MNHRIEGGKKAADQGLPAPCIATYITAIGGAIMNPVWWQVSPVFDIALNTVAHQHCSKPTSVVDLRRGAVFVQAYSQMAKPDLKNLFVNKALQVWALMVNVCIRRP